MSKDSSGDDPRLDGGWPLPSPRKLGQDEILAYAMGVLDRWEELDFVAALARDAEAQALLEQIRRELFPQTAPVGEVAAEFAGVSLIRDRWERLVACLRFDAAGFHALFMGWNAGAAPPSAALLGAAPAEPGLLTRGIPPGPSQQQARLELRNEDGEVVSLELQHGVVHIHLAFPGSDMEGGKIQVMRRIREGDGYKDVTAWKEAVIRGGCASLPRCPLGVLVLVLPDRRKLLLEIKE